MAIIRRSGIPAQRTRGFGTQIEGKLLEKLLVDLPTAAVKTAAGLPIFGGDDGESEEDKILREAIERLIGGGAAGGSRLTPTAPLLAPTAPAGQTLTSTGLGSGVPVTLMPQGF
jgi:hypothetical protein